MTPLHAAVSCRRLDGAEMLLSKGAEPNAQGASGETPLHLGMDHRLARLLIQHDGNPALDDHWPNSTSTDATMADTARSGL